MMRFLGKSVAKSCRMGMQYRSFSSGADVTTTGKKIVEYCYKGAFCGVGYVIGGLISTPVAKQVQESEEMAIKQLQHLDENEAKWKVILKE